MRARIISLFLGSVAILFITGGMIALLHSQGAEQKDIAMQSQAKDLTIAVVKHFLGIEAR